MSWLRDASGASQFFRFDAEPVAKGRPRFVSRSFAGGKSYTSAYTPAKTRNAESALQAELKAMGPDLYERGVPLIVMVEFIVRRPKSVKAPYPVSRPDLDNYLKLLKDACNGYLWHDDSQVIQVGMLKRYARENELPHIEMRVSRAE